MSFEYKQFYRRKLPHRHSPGSTLFVTFRLRNSIPRAVIDKRKAELRKLEADIKALTDHNPDPETAAAELKQRFQRRWFARFEDALHLEKGPLWLKEPDVAMIVANSLHFLNGRAYDLHAFCIMANHVHTQFTPFLDERSLSEVREETIRLESSDPTLGAIMQSLKGYTARECNKLLGRKGQFWEPESFDHEVRNGQEYRRIKKYILNNPVKAGLVENWQDWKWNWVESSQ